jgi:hypothetical protein
MQYYYLKKKWKRDGELMAVLLSKRRHYPKKMIDQM